MKGVVFAVRLLSLTTAATGLIASAHAEGAFAVGMTDNDGRAGAAYGVTYNYSTQAEAKYNALLKCLEVSSSDANAARCRIRETFSNACMAIAWNPTEGEPGIGWAQAPSREQAQSRAISACRTNAGYAYGAKCVVQNVSCDGSSGHVASLSSGPQSNAIPGATGALKRPRR